MPPFAERDNVGPMPVKSVFLDRDGVINLGIAGEYVKSWKEFEFLPGAKEALARLRSGGLRLFIVTNQRGVARGQLSLTELDSIHGRMLDELRQANIRIDGIYVCIHDEEECSCRKPQVGLFLRAHKEFPDIDFTASAVIGDSLSDMEAGTRLGCRTILITHAVQSDIVLEEARRRGIVVDRIAESLWDAAARHPAPAYLRCL
jgi:histidinol-phosphate phosphatase family protein